MAAKSLEQATGYFEPLARSAFFSSLVKGKVYLWGGYNEDFLCSKISSKEFLAPVYSFDPYQEIWMTQKATGSLLVGVCKGSCASNGHHLYTYGGLDRDAAIFDGSLNSLNTETLTWSKLVSSGSAPMTKYASGMITFNNQLLLFGGYGIPSGPIQQGSAFIRDASYNTGRGWTNELHTYNFIQGSWSSPDVTGDRPPPSAGFTFTKITNHTAVMFGGKHSGAERSSDVYILDLTTMDWRKLDFDKEEAFPVGRAGHAAVCLNYNGDHPQLLVIGGKDNQSVVLDDMWLLDVNSRKWREVETPILQSRCYHSATAVRLSPYLVEVTVFGGVPEWPVCYRSDLDLTHIAATTVLRFEYLEQPTRNGPSAFTKEWVLTDVTVSSELSTEWRVRKKEKFRITAEKEAAFVKKIDEVLAKGDNIHRKLAHSVITGPTGSGKTSLILRLLQRKLKKFSKSTGTRVYNKGERVSNYRYHLGK